MPTEIYSFWPSYINSVKIVNQLKNGLKKYFDDSAFLQDGLVQPAALIGHRALKINEREGQMTEKGFRLSQNFPASLSNC